MLFSKDALPLNSRRLVSARAKGVALALSISLVTSFSGYSAHAQEGQSAQQTDAPAATQNRIVPTETPSMPAQVAPQTPNAPVVNDTPAAPATPAAPTVTEVAPVAPVAPQVQDEAVDLPATTPSDVEVVDPNNRSDIPHDLSPWGMFMAADWVVKGVMIGLAVASVLTWTVLVAKTLELMGARLRANRTLRVVRESRSLNDAIDGIQKSGGPAAMMVRMADHEMKLSDGVVDHTDGGGIKERVTSVLNRIEVHAGRRMARGTGILATIGSISPFVGLFGTVWGIMNSFISISESQTTNLAIVAPGIAEALLATAIGLVAAIPAVVFYNIFARSITGYRQLLADVAAGVERLVSRDIDYRRVPPGSAKPNVTLVGR